MRATSSLAKPLRGYASLGLKVRMGKDRFHRVRRRDETERDREAVSQPRSFVES
jgi:hypothetical protein